MKERKVFSATTGNVLLLFGKITVDIISLNDNAVLVEGKLYKKNEVVKIIRTDIEGIASTSADLLPYGKFRMNNEKSRNAGTGIFRSLFFLRP